MNRILTPLVFAFGTSSLLLMDSAIKGSVILLGAACVAVMLKRDSAAMRHLVWLVAIVSMLVVPVFSVLLPRWQVLPAWAAISQSSPAIETSNRAVELPRTFEAASADSPEPFDPGEFESQRQAIDTSHNSEVLEQPRIEVQQDYVGMDRATSDPSWSWMTVLPFLWSIGFGVLILRLMAARWMLWSNEQRATVIAVSGSPNDARKPLQHESDAAIAAAFENAHRQLGIRQRVQLLIDSDRTIPVVWGIFWFRLMLPESVRQWSSEQLRSVLLHELAHIKRRDTMVQLLTQFACALHWFNPLVWFAAWRLHVERERACDDLVLAQGVRASAYAEHLLNVATKLSVARWTSACGLAMASHSPLESRLQAILSGRLNRRKVSTAIGMMGLLLGAGVAIPIAMLRAAAEDWKPPSGAHIGSNEFSAYCVHDGKNAAFVIAYQGFTGSSSAHDSNSKTRTWTDSGTITAKKPSIMLSFHRTHTASDKLSITTAPAEARDRSKPAAPLGEFGQKEYDLAKGRVFLLSDNGSVRQLDIATPIVTDQKSAMKLAALIAAIPPQEGNDAAFMTNFSVQLSPETIAKLKWGEPVNGLRMALAYPPALGDAMLGKKPHFELVVQNVSEKEIHFLASDEAPNPRNLYIREGDRIVLGLSDPTTSAADWKLQPGECGVVRMYTKEESNKDGTIPSSGIESDLSKLGRYHAIVHMEIAKAPEGAWTGKLITGETRGTADVAAAPTPLHKDAQSLYEVWQRYARTNGDIPGALLGELAASVMQFIKYNPTWETVPKLNAILPRLDATRDWKPAEAIALLDEVAGIQDSPLSPAPWKGTKDTIRQGEVLPKKYADVAWGEEQPSGLRAAWVLEPGAAEYRIGTALKVRLLVQNRGQVPVMLQVPTFHQGWVKGTDAKGSEVQVSGISWTTMALLNTVRLEPGASVEINTPGVGIGPRAGMGPWAGPRVGSNVLAKAGDELTLTHGLVPLDGSEVGVSEDDPHVSGPGWWLAHIKTRLNRELPLPADVAERTRLLDRAVRELFATAPTAEETEAFIADKTPDALDALAKRLASRVNVVSFSGKLPTAPVKFRVLDADANADKQPRVVLGPGEYPLPCTTADRGQATLKIVGKPVGDRRTNEAQILFEATEATGKLPPDPHKLDVPDGWGKWAIVCRPDSGVFYLLSKGTVRKIDYSNPRQVTDTLANDLPAEFRDEVKRQLDIHEISDETQAEVFEKPASPAATPEAEKPKGAAVKLTPDALLGFWRGTMDGKDLMLSFHRPPVEKEVQVQIYFDRSTIGRLARFTIAPNGDSALVVIEGADNAALGTLRPIDANTLRLESSDKEGKASDFVMLDRDVEPPATEPRQKEARELFEMWKRTANEDGTISGTFIGQLATEVRAYVKENPNLNSGMELPKLLPRFVTTRDWTQAEAIKLLDDVAYYSTAPIQARVAKSKLPSDALYQTKVEFQDIPVAIAEWSEAKDGLRIGMRVVEGEWRVGGEVNVEMWLHNAGAKDLTLKANPQRSDVGVWVVAKDSEGQDHGAANGNILILAIPQTCVLPAGRVAKIKKFTLSLDATGNKEQAWVQPRFRELQPGSYKLRCEWSDAERQTGYGPDFSTDKFWTGKLTMPELDFTLVAQDAPKTASERKLPSVDGPPVNARLADDRYAKSGVPLAEQTWPMPPWGAEKDGLSAGLRVIGDARSGGEVKAELWVRNTSAKDVKFSHCPRTDVGLSVIAKGADGKEHFADITQFRGKPGFNRLLLPAGNVVKLKEFTMKLGAKTDGERVNLDLPLGDYKLRAVWSDTTSWAVPEGEWSAKLTAAKAGADVEKPAAKPPGANIVTVPDDQYVKSGFPADELAGEVVTWNDVQNGLSLGYRITGDEWRILGKEVKVELWVQNLGDKDVKFQDNMRADPEFGLRVKLKDAKGEDHSSNFWPDDRPPFGFHRLLPPGHALKVKEFTISLFWPENDFSHAKGHFFGINPGAYDFHCELELPGFSATGEGGKQLTPAAGEWTGKLTTRGLNVEVIAPDAPAPQPRIESTQDGEQPIETIPVTSKELSGIWYGATDRTGVVVRFIGRESRIKDTQGTVSGEWVVHVVDGSIVAALEITDDPKAGAVRITAGLWNDKTKQGFTLSLGSVERGEDGTLYLTIDDNSREPMYLPTKRIQLTFIEDRDEIQRSDVEKMQSLMQSLKPR